MLKKCLALLVFAISASAFSQDSVDVLARKVFNFTYFGSHLGGYSMVSCDYATHKAEELFGLFGAKRVDVTCHGGIQPPGTITPLSLRVTYEPVVLGENTRVATEVYRSDAFERACDFNSRFVRAAVRSAKNVRIARASDGCMSPDSSWRFDFKVTLPATE